jgi:hypothetical protein
MGIVPDGNKFAAISFYGTGMTWKASPSVSLPNGLFGCKVVPFEVTEWWRGQLGQLTCEELERSDFSLVATMPSSALAVLDRENLDLERRCQNLYYGMLIGHPVSSELAPQLVTGSVLDGKATFRQIGRAEFPSHVFGAPVWDISPESLATAATYCEQLEALGYAGGRFGRAIWALNCFMAGITSTNVYEKLRDFIRTVEAFLLPDIGRTTGQFKTRTELFVGSGHQDLTELMYRARSKVEHLHDPLAIMPKGDGTARLINFCRLAWISESVARHCLATFLARQEVRDQFMDDDRIRQFWTRPPFDQRAIWGPSLEMSSIESLFDPVLAKAEIG